jgi:transposase
LYGTNTAGGAAGQTFGVTGVPKFSGRIETFTPSVGLARQRICTRQRTLTRVKRGAWWRWRKRLSARGRRAKGGHGRLFLCPARVVDRVLILVDNVR